VYRDRWIDEYRRIVEDAGETERAIERFDLRVFFLEPEMAPLAARLAARADWRIVYADAVSTILMRRDTAPHLPALELSDESWWRDVRERLPATVPYDEIPWYRRVVSPRPYTRLARFCFTMQAYDRAVVLFEDARRAYPAGFADLEPLALAAERSGRYESAADYYAEALLAAPQGSELGKRLALSRLRSGDAPGAIRALDDYLAAHAEDAEGLALRGNVELSAGRPAQAVAWLERAIAAAPQEWLYRHFLGRLLLELERWEEARSALEAAARLAPRQLDPVLDLIALSLRQGEAQRAREWLRRAQAIAPDDPRVRAAAAAVRGVS
jgi:Flp pilus assembly protein TadD